MTVRPILSPYVFCPIAVTNSGVPPSSRSASFHKGLHLSLQKHRFWWHYRRQLIHNELSIFYLSSSFLCHHNWKSSKSAWITLIWDKSHQVSCNVLVFRVLRLQKWLPKPVVPLLIDWYSVFHSFEFTIIKHMSSNVISLETPNFNNL